MIEKKWHSIQKASCTFMSFKDLGMCVLEIFIELYSERFQLQCVNIMQAFGC